MVRKFPKALDTPRHALSHGVPRSMRKQIYLPEFTITLVRTPFLPPRYASFSVPLNFNKLDLRDYLDRVYGVTAVSIRSYVQQQKVTRERPLGKTGLGKLRRPMSKKRMTVEMTEPFVWPDPPEDMAPWEKDYFFKAKEYQDDKREQLKPDAGKKPAETERKAYKEQAEELLEGKQTWRPTWQALGLNYDRSSIFKGNAGKGSSSSSTSSSS